MTSDRKNQRELTLFGKRVKRRLNDLNMSQLELATEIGIHYTYLSQILRGHKSGEKYILQIANFLGIDPEKYLPKGVA